jgi:hypothetical protein
MDAALESVRWEAEQLTTALGATVLPVLCVHDTHHLLWGELDVAGVRSVPVVTPSRLVATLRALPAHLDKVGVMLLARARPPPASPRSLMAPTQAIIRS